MGDPIGGEEEFQKDRKDLLAGYITYITDRFEKLIKHPVFLAAKAIFEQRSWPQRAINNDNPSAEVMQELDAHGCADLDYLLGHYKAFFTEGEVAEAKLDWLVFKRAMVKLPSVFKLRPPQFWQYITDHYGHAGRHELLIRLQLLVSLIPLDTSECERGFSLLTLIQTYMRNRLSVQHIDELMRICCLGPDIEGMKQHAFPIMCAWMDASKKGRYLGKLDGNDDNVSYFDIDIN